ncbi:MAG: hypothetical protein H0U61_06960 [Nocardioidaceae bacterium]|jgi:quinol monooxygenase YgiN|nr:hypothetical protein [Nocardioidaceae bacterium]
MTGFVQIIEFQSSRLDDLKKLVEERREQGPGSALRGTITADRDRPGTYLNIVEFESAEAAAENSNRPETQEMAAKMAELCDGPPKFYNLDLIESWEA